jgi:uncharacterized protein
VVVVGGDEHAERLDLAAAAAPFAVNRSTVRLTRAQISLGLGGLPPLLEETLPHLPQLQGTGSFALVCRGSVCLPPVTSPEELLEMLRD